ncbi:hypothetical protein KM295_00305 [Natronomonas sp. F2-12]|uniref:CARDB domain-containing protein n=1 Tax=Natronomonas aquatica TaxID=2841590 RepID=A0A9R1CQE1_9EURY|nr:CARDB domain-containing protein [Natronomonas aquatica]MCQ4331947.1 hypothetical protein [Natronomonas aquatica]
MPNRRKVLIGLGGSIALAGCSGETEEPESEDQDQTEEDDSEEQGSESGQQEQEGEAVFELSEIIDGETYSQDEEVIIGANVENTGDIAGEQTIEISSEWYSYEETVELEPGEGVRFGARWNSPEDIEADNTTGNLEYTILTEDDELSGSITIEEPGEAVFEFTDVEPDGVTVNYGEEVELEVTIENTGDQEGTQTLEYYLDDELVDESQITLDSSESTAITVGINTELWSEGELEYRFTSEDDEITGSIEITIDEPATQSFSGSGQSVEDGVEIEGGLTVVEATHSGESNFQVSLVDDSEFDDNFINVIGDFDGSQADLIDSGEYMLDVNADGSWSIDIHQPRSGSGEDLPKSLSGSEPDVVGPIEFGGTHVADGSHSGESNFQVQVYPMEGSFAETVFNEIGEFDGETTFSFDGVGWVDINADGSWEVNIE